MSLECLLLLTSKATSPLPESHLGAGCQGKCTPILKRFFLLAPNMAAPRLPTAVTSHLLGATLFLPNTPASFFGFCLVLFGFIFSLKHTTSVSIPILSWLLSLLASPKRLLSTRESTSRPWTQSGLPTSLPGHYALPTPHPPCWPPCLLEPSSSLSPKPASRPPPQQ